MAGAELDASESSRAPPGSNRNTAAFFSRFFTAHWLAIIPGLVVRGRMPLHRHGLGARAEAGETDEPGVYRIDGLLFQMPGEWELWIEVSPVGEPPERIVVTFVVPDPTGYPRWSDEQRGVLTGLRLDQSRSPPTDPSNAWADDEAAARLGHALFFDEGLSADGTISCATCHQPDRYFTDGRDRSVGMGTTLRNAPTVVGAAWSRWQMWDGAADSLWAQAIVPMEGPDEHGLTRVAVARRVAAAHRERYESVFGPLPTWDDESRFPVVAGPAAGTIGEQRWAAMDAGDQAAVTAVVVNAAKAIAAYQRLLKPAVAPFDAYVEAVALGDDDEARDLLSATEARGLALFIGRGQCIQCHGGPRLTFDGFHNTGLPVPPEPRDDTAAQATWLAAMADRGRETGQRVVLESPFRCGGPYDVATESDCHHLAFLDLSADDGAASFKTPSLRGVADTAPYMHDGRF